ncbi:MAG: thioredoxin domain-containing protein, partial [Gammaproteobacteria bacterium]|nr:thioredoxin domain-containing protein [Gammaproteobacteria bacterium]
MFFLWDSAIRQQNNEILDALKLTMDLMARGGIYDQIGGGFHRYSTDNAWLVPHFEKMLYNQGNLVRNYAALYEVTHDYDYKRIVEQTLGYVVAEMQTADGVFYSAGDADSEGEEGKYFLWTQEQIQQSLSADLAKLAIDIYAVSKEGNFSEHPMTEATVSGNVGKSILNQPVSMNEYAQENSLDIARLYENIDQIRGKLYQTRQQRVAPAIDKKVVTAWNAMMITAFAQAGMKLNKQSYIDIAKKA